MRGQLIWSAALGTAVILLGSCAVLYALIQRTLVAEFDEALVDKTRTLAAHVEREGDFFDLESLEGPLTEFDEETGTEYFELLFPDGRVVARSPSLRNKPLDHVPPVADSPAIQTVTLPDGRRGKTAAISFVPREDHPRAATSGTEMIFVVGCETETLQKTLAKVAAVLSAVCIGAVLVSSALLAWIVQRRLKPLQSLSQQIAALEERELSKPVVVDNAPEEMQPVIDRLNDLLARLNEAFQRERRFTGDVAHELRTPIAGLRAKLELALSRERSVETYRSTISDCLQINHQMQSMVENLLHLARADSGQAEVRRGTVDLPELFRECWKPLEAKARMRALSVDWDISTVGEIESDRDKLQLVVRNLLDNAVSHASNAGHVHVATWADNGAVSLSVSNTATPLPPDQLKHIFDRFWRGDSSFRSGETHCGLGLPLCKTLVEQLGGTIRASCESSDRFSLTIRMPNSAPTRLPSN